MSVVPSSAGNGDPVAAVLRCPVCGGELERRGPEYACVEGHEVLRVVERRATSGSTVAFLARPHAGGLVLKIPAQAYREWSAASKEPRTAQEAEALVRAADALGSGPLRVPRVHRAGTVGDALLVDEAPGVDLETLLYGRAALLFPRRVARGFAGAGEWLGAMMEPTSEAPTAFDPSEWLETARRLLRSVEDAGFPAAAAARSALEASARSAWGIPSRRCFVHGDFRAKHVYVTGDVVTVIDFEQAHRGWVHEDAAFFLASLDGLSDKHPLRRLNPAGRRCRRAFLDQYLARSTVRWDESAEFLHIAAMVRALFLEYRGSLRRRAPALFERLVVPHYARWFRRRA